MVSGMQAAESSKHLRKCRAIHGRMVARCVQIVWLPRSSKHFKTRYLVASANQTVAKFSSSSSELRQHPWNKANPTNTPHRPRPKRAYSKLPQVFSIGRHTQDVASSDGRHRLPHRQLLASYILFLNPRNLACRERCETKCRVPGYYALVGWPGAELLLACVIAIGVMEAIGWRSK